MRRNIFGMWVSEEEKSKDEIAVEYIRKLKIELDGTDIMNAGIPLNNQFICDMFLQLFEKYPPTFVDIADFMEKVKENSTMNGE